MATLFVGNLYLNAIEAELVDLFTNFGEVSSVSVHTETILGHTHRFAYVDFKNENDAKSAMELNSNSHVHITWYKPDAGKIFISNLDKHMKKEDLRVIFADFGKILSCKVAKNHKGMSIGCAFVHFETEEAAHACINLSDGQKLFGEMINVEKFNLSNEDELDELDEKKKLAMQFKMAIRNSLFNSTEDFEQPKTDDEVESKFKNSCVEKSNLFVRNEEELDEKNKDMPEFNRIPVESVKVCEQEEIDCDNEVMEITNYIEFFNQFPNLKNENTQNIFYQAANRCF